MKCAVLGCGRWGSFVAWYLNSLGNEVKLWGRPESIKMADLLKYKRNSYINFETEAKVFMTTDLKTTVEEAEYVFVAIHSQGFAEFMKELSTFDLSKKIFVLCMKGLDFETHERMSQIAKKYIDINNIAVMAGPGQPAECVEGKKTCMVIDSDNIPLEEDLAKKLRSDLIHFDTGGDLIGTEISSVCKDIIGIAGGMLDGLKQKPLKGALMVYATREVASLITKMGGVSETAYGICLLGDFEASMFSENSLTRKLGETLVVGGEFDEKMQGLDNVKSVYELSKKYDVKMPVCNAVYEVVYNKKDPKEVMEQVFNLL